MKHTFTITLEHSNGDTITAKADIGNSIVFLNAIEEKDFEYFIKEYNEKLKTPEELKAFFKIISECSKK